MSRAMRVLEEVSQETGISTAEMLGKSRLAAIVAARREAIRRMYLLKRMSTPVIADVFGVRHTSVRHHLRAAGISGCRSRLLIKGQP